MSQVFCLWCRSVGVQASSARSVSELGTARRTVVRCTIWTIVRWVTGRCGNDSQLRTWSGWGACIATKPGTLTASSTGPRTTCTSEGGNFDIVWLYFTQLYNIYVIRQHWQVKTIIEVSTTQTPFIHPPTSHLSPPWPASRRWRTGGRKCVRVHCGGEEFWGKVAGDAHHLHV